jgi:hypothetical protein
MHAGDLLTDSRDKYVFSALGVWSILLTLNSSSLPRLGGANLRASISPHFLTLIVLLLSVIALKLILQPQSALAEGNFAGIQFSYSGGNHAFFDTRSGDVWEYGDNGHFRQHYKVREFGKDHERHEH